MAVGFVYRKTIALFGMMIYTEPAQLFSPGLESSKSEPVSGINRNANQTNINEPVDESSQNE